MTIPRRYVWLWNTLAVIGMLYLIWRGKWWTLVISATVGFALGFAAAIYERAGHCLPWKHEWDVRRVSVPLWDISAKGELKTCIYCGKVVAK